MATHKKKPSKGQHLRRNAAPPARPLPRAVVANPRSRLPGGGGGNGSIGDDTNGWRTIKALGGTVATTVAGALLARQTTLPPKLMTGLISGVGAALAFGAPNPTVRSVALGAMSAAGGQLGFMLIDDELFTQQAEVAAKLVKDQAEAMAKIAKDQKPAAAPASARRGADDVPPDALMRAFDRARRRLALTRDTQA